MKVASPLVSGRLLRYASFSEEVQPANRSRIVIMRRIRVFIGSGLVVKAQGAGRRAQGSRQKQDKRQKYKDKRKIKIKTKDKSHKTKV